MIVDTKQPERTREGDIAFATECALQTLVNRAVLDGRLSEMFQNIGLMYLPEQAVTQQFKDACSAVIVCLEKAGVQS